MLKESPHGNRCICWPLLLALAIVIASSNPVVGPFANWVWQADKVIHFSVFGFMALLIARVRLIQRNTPWGAMTAVVIVAAFGALDELHQLTTPGRVCDFKDWLADVLGALTFVAAYVYSPAYRQWVERRVIVVRGSRVRIALPGLPTLGFRFARFV